MITLLIIKHFICDFLLQGPYQYKNKGTFGHPGGLLHAFITILGTAVVFWFLHVDLAYWPVLLGTEFVVHYLMDWSKVNVNKYMGWGPTTHEEFWILLGWDQLVHMLTYVWMQRHIVGVWL